MHMVMGVATEARQVPVTPCLVRCSGTWGKEGRRNVEESSLTLLQDLPLVMSNSKEVQKGCET